jgi:alkylhydroperoxidase/carboxymuconolactone decarboxylase family protein YurZ
MFDEIKQIRGMRKKYNLQMFRSGIDTFRELGELEGNALRDGVLTQKHKELIALGISISQSCYG